MGSITVTASAYPDQCFFACSEIAVVSLNEKKIEKLADDGNKKAAKILSMLKNPEKFLSTIQISITLAGFLGSAFAADNFAGKLSSWVCNDLKFTALSEKPSVLSQSSL